MTKRLSLDEFMSKNSHHFDYLTRIQTEEQGRLYYKYCETITAILEMAKFNKLLPSVKAEVLARHGIEHSTSVKMRAVYNFWKDKTESERRVFFQKFINNKSKLEFLSGVYANKQKGSLKAGRFEKIEIDTEMGDIRIVLNKPKMVYKIEDLPFKKLKEEVLGSS